MSYTYYGDEKKFTYIYLDTDSIYLYLNNDDEQNGGDDYVQEQ